MKSHKYVYFCILGIIVVFGLFVLYQRLQAQSVLNAFLKEHHLKSNDILFGSYERPFLGEGLILYDVKIPRLKLVHEIDKVIIRQEDENIIIQFQGVNLDVSRTLYMRYGQLFEKILSQYKPFDDALRKPMISLGLMGIDTIRFDMVLIFNPSDRMRIINGKILLPRLGEIQVSFTIEPKKDEGYRNNLVYIGYGDVIDINVDVQDTGMFKKYADYLRTIGTPKMTGYAKELMRHSGFTRRIEFQPRPSLVPYYYNEAR